MSIKKMQMEKLEHSPTLNTVMMVENALENAEGSAISIPSLKKSLPRQVNHNTLMVILDYLERSNKIMVGLRGITWVHNPNWNLKKAIATGLEL